MRDSKEQRAIISGLEAQGVAWRKQKRGTGVIFALPNGKTAALHATISDSKRGLLNLRTEIRAAGLLWPLDTDYPKHLK